jgi:CRISPR-associated protein Cst2
MVNQMRTPVYSLGISGRLTLDLHSLNNEGGEGNQIATRTVNVVYQPEAVGGRRPPVRLAAVNAISGDMFKHIQAEHLFHTAVARGLPLCRGCREFNSNRILADPGFKSRFTKATPDREVLEMVLQTCTLDDLEGILVTENNKSLPRKSLVEFGWVVGVPELVQTEQYFHAKYVSDSGNLQRSESAGANLGQNIFGRLCDGGGGRAVAHRLQRHLAEVFPGDRPPGPLRGAYGVASAHVCPTQRRNAQHPAPTRGRV